MTEATFSELAERHRSQLRAHCYRMLGSLEESEDVVQETFLRAWRRRASFRGESFRAWLYRIATNACLDALQRRNRRSRTAHAVRQAWIGPDPESTSEEPQAAQTEPLAAVVAKETVELTFMVAIRHLPARQQAVLILRDVLGCSAHDAASLLASSVPSVNSALQRARRTLRDRLPEQRLEWPLHSAASEEERALLGRYLEATERGDAEAFVETLRQAGRLEVPEALERLDAPATAGKRRR